VSQPPSQDEARFQVLFDQVLLYLGQHFSVGVSWSGQSYHLTLDEQGRAKASLALLHLIIQQWLPLIEYPDIFTNHL
jgi:hypothetical protein